MTDANTPVLVGVGQVTEKPEALASASSPVDLMEHATWRAVEDAGIGREALGDLDALVVVRSFRESTRNSPEALARRLGAERATQWLMPNGGNGPQYLVNRFSEAIARGEARFALFSGAEAIDTGRRIVKGGGKPAWDEPTDRDPAYLYPERPMSTDYEQAHGLFLPANFYAMCETALRHHYGHTVDAHQRSLGELFAPFTEVAAESPYAWFPVRRSAEEIATPSSTNRYVGWPYTKFMNAMNQINQSATLLLTSVAHARALGIDEHRWVYLHGCADANELWFVGDRLNYHSSPAIRTMGQQAFAMADRGIDEMAFLDLYSCFPSAVQIARDELGLAKNDTRPLTVTGGLPFHGGAGNNYVMNSIAAMIDKLRANPGEFGLVTANGGYLTKHAIGIYSTTPVQGPWQRVDPAVYQVTIDGQPHPPVVEAPEGAGLIEAYTVVHGRDGAPERGLVIGRLGAGDDGMAPRFFATVPQEAELLEAMTAEEFVGRAGRVTRDGEQNSFRPAL